MTSQEWNRGGPAPPNPNQNNNCYFLTTQELSGLMHGWSLAGGQWQCSWQHCSLEVSVGAPV